MEKMRVNFAFDIIKEADDEIAATKERLPATLGVTLLSFGSISVTLMSSSLRRVETMFSS